jgi:hypothetical protein
VKGHILPGTVMAIYAGTVHFPYTLTEDVVKNNNYMYGRYDGTCDDYQTSQTRTMRTTALHPHTALRARVGVVVDGRDWERKAFASRRLQSRLEVPESSPASLQLCGGR